VNNFFYSQATPHYAGSTAVPCLTCVKQTGNPPGTSKKKIALLRSFFIEKDDQGIIFFIARQPRTLRGLQRFESARDLQRKDRTVAVFFYLRGDMARMRSFWSGSLFVIRKIKSLQVTDLPVAVFFFRFNPVTEVIAPGPGKHGAVADRFDIADR